MIALSTCPLIAFVVIFKGGPPCDLTADVSCNRPDNCDYLVLHPNDYPFDYICDHLLDYFPVIDSAMIELLIILSLALLIFSPVISLISCWLYMCMVYDV